ncbi:hypothetical protein [Brucella pseudogrignonensis]|uniref:Uncharacterized protein n=1 Tax=Brucella pseudogrignonensis TaxID=419475 RepID=A0A256GFD9_9HYPH|nr:hypothetical protein [Brucella pseudogrignonensis]OYR25867.1 hypothetical protein CEV34_2680 [Brucella pseudogrignonensis]
MTEQANGPVAVEATAPAPQTTATDSTVITDHGSNGGNENWVAGLQIEDNRTLVEAKQWKSADDAIKSYRDLEAHASKALKVPGADATAEDWNAFYGKLGRPESPDKYELKLNTEAVPQDFPYDEKSAIEFRTWAHEAGLTPQQAQSLHDKFVGQQAGVFSSTLEQQAKAEGDAHRAITSQWGDPDTDGYKHNLEYTSRAISQLGLKDSLVKGGILSPQGAVLDPNVAFALAKVGKEMYGEDSTATNASGSLNNPFSSENFNLTQQGKLIRDDPSKAKSLIRAAGGNPAEFGL